jgi:hypothetical protein
MIEWNDKRDRRSAYGVSFDVSHADRGGFQEYRKSITKRMAKNMGGCVSPFSYSCTLARGRQKQERNNSDAGWP